MTQDDADGQHIGVALSGGGHRATIWGLGALLYLIDAGKHREVSVISSVSGGSILNGAVAHELDFAKTTRGEFVERMRPLTRHVADTGLFFWGRATNAYVVSVFALGGVGVIALLAGVVLLGVDGLSLRAGSTLIVSLALLVAALLWFQRRSEVVDRALATTHFHRNGRPTTLGSLDRSLDHVMCATELQSGEHLYFAPRFVYSYRVGLGRPGDLRLSTAVQASACLPGAFAPRRLPTAVHRFTGGLHPTGEVVLTDGGVYDNMADQWLVGLPARLRRCPSLPAVGTTVDEVIVVNGSSPVQWSPMRRLRLSLLAEVATLQRVNSVMYAVTTERRRYALVNEWDAAQRDGVGQRGGLVHISQSPFTVADRYAASTRWPERAARAANVINLLGDDPAARESWRERATASSRVPTVLRKLGRATTLDLLEHAYVVAMCNLHVLLDYPLLARPDRARFAGLLDEAEVKAAP